MSIRPFSNPMLTAILIFLLFSVIARSACRSEEVVGSEILIAIEPEYIPLLINPGKLDPVQTGIPSLDILNQEWHVTQMVVLYPDISPDDEIAARYGLAGVFRLVVPANTNLSAMINAYMADLHIQYAELNKPVQINE